MGDKKKSAPDGDQEQITVDKNALRCMARHFKAFYEQCRDNKPGDFAQPCVECTEQSTCKLHWDDYILPICSAVGVQVYTLIPLVENQGP